MTTAPTPSGTEPRTFWVLYEDGSAGRISADAAEDEPPTLAKAGRVVTEEEYDAYVTALAAQRDEHLAEVRDQEQARAREDYDALRVAGVPEATARRMSGYVEQAEES
ncbi:hypothetical protein [Streptomyces sp. CA-253872]|uniref:hypothetical protein n=1 Tax=Streptomyces sp. CA-253872 TaxID=3240067 RepID=UPI003D8CDE91